MAFREELTNSAKEYILGTNKDELDRLGFQHKVWSQDAFSLWDTMGMKIGHRVLDLGCGPGFASFDIAKMVGENGKVVGIDKSPEYIQSAKNRARLWGVNHSSFIQADFSEMRLEADYFDRAYCRWALCWLSNPQETINKVVESLKPGGLFGAQEYLNWGTLKVYPDFPEINRVIEACREGWRVMEGNIDVGPSLVQKFADSRLEIVHLKSISKLGRKGDMVWQWPGSFFKIYSLKLIEMGWLTHDERSSFLTAWEEIEKNRDAFLVTPTMMEVIGRKK